MVTLLSMVTCHGNMTTLPISIKDSMEVTIKSKVTINGKFYATGPWTIPYCTGIGPDEWICWLHGCGPVGELS